MSFDDKKVISLSFLTVIFIAFVFCFKKQGMFTDEIYTFGLANSFYAPYIADAFGGNLINQIISSSDLFNYITVNPDERFCFDSVFYNQSHDTLPPLYYCLIHFISSLFPKTFSKWYGLSLNLFLYMSCLLALYKLSNKIFDNNKVSMIVVIFYGLSSIGLSTMLMIRMYILLTLLTVLLAFFSIQFTEKQNIKYGVIISTLNYFGILTHYYYVIYAFFLFIIIAYSFICKKNYKSAYYYFVFNVLGCLLFLFSFPEFINQLFARKLVSGYTAYANMFTWDNYKNIFTYAYYFISQTFLMHVFLGLIVLICIFNSKNVLAKCRIKCYYNIIILPAFLSFFIVSVISPIVAERYIYNLVPILCLVTAREFMIARSVNNNLLKLENQIIFFVLIVSILFLALKPPRFLYTEMPKINDMLVKYKNNPCVFLDNNYSSPIIENLDQLMIFENFIVINDIESPLMRKYIQEKPKNDKIVIYIDTNKFFSSGYDAENKLNDFKYRSEYKEHKYLYSNFSVVVYELAK